MSYLAEVKKQLRETHDQVFTYSWEEVKEALKQRYRNGYDEGVKAAKEGKEEPAKTTDTAGRCKGRTARAASREEASS